MDELMSARFKPVGVLEPEQCRYNGMIGVLRPLLRTRQGRLNGPSDFQR